MLLRQQSAVASSLIVLDSHQLHRTLTVRLPEDLAAWLDATSKRTGVPQGRIVREQLERARRTDKRSFLRLAGAVAGPADLSKRRGFSRT